MITINNKEKRVVVLKAFGQMPQRFFPGHNQVNIDSLSPYFKDSPVNQAIAKESLEKVGVGEVRLDEAIFAREKNDRLNKSSVALKVAQAKLVKAAESADGDKKTINTLMEKILKLESALETAVKRLDQIDEITDESDETNEEEA